MAEGTATYLKQMEDFRGNAALYWLDPPLTQESWKDDSVEVHEYVIVSAAVVPFSGLETYIFPAEGPDAEMPVDFGALKGSQKGTLSHEGVLTDLGYRIVHTVEQGTETRAIES